MPVPELFKRSECNPLISTHDLPYQANVVFPCGGFVREGELWVYYGACDSSICLATARIEDLLEVVLAERVE